MKISIITATYNSEKSIKTCLDSVISQDYSDIEYIIIDGKSLDQTLNIINGYQQKYSNIKLISESDQGIYHALNKGVKLAVGDVIGFVHSDDLLANKHIVSELVNLIKVKQLDGLYGDLQYVDKFDLNKVIRLWKSSKFKKSLLKKGWMPAHPTLFLKKNIYKKHGVFNLNYKISADYDFMLRILKDNTLNFEYLPKVITKMRVGGASNRSLKNIIQKTIEDYHIVRSNNIGGFTTVILKNISKIKQFF
jgi:glycosyltransferase